MFADWDRSAPGAGVGHIYGPGPFRSGSRFVFGREFFVNTVWDPFGSGSRFYSVNLIVIRPKTTYLALAYSRFGIFGFGGPKINNK